MSRNLKLGTKRTLGRDNWVAGNERLNSNSTCFRPCLFRDCQWAGAEWGQLGKKLPPSLLRIHYTTALRFNSFSLHTYKNREVVLPHPVLFNCEWLYWFVTEQFSYFEKIVARYTHLLLSAQGYWSMETDRIRWNKIVRFHKVYLIFFGLLNQQMSTVVQ